MHCRDWLELTREQANPEPSLPRFFVRHPADRLQPAPQSGVAPLPLNLHRVASQTLILSTSQHFRNAREVFLRKPRSPCRLLYFLTRLLAIIN